MRPWELIDKLSEETLRQLRPDDPFWVGAGFAMDPFRGAVVTLSLRDPPEFGAGLPVSAFDKLLRGIIDGSISGDQIVLGIEIISKHATREEWTLWYKPIIAGQLRLPISIKLYNKYAPESRKVVDIIAAQPTPITSMADLPEKMIINTIPFGIDPMDRTLWFINQKGKQPQVRGYDLEGNRLHRPGIQEAFMHPKFGLHSGLVVEGYLGGDRLLVSDAVTLEQFLQKETSPSLSERVNVAFGIGVTLRNLGLMVYAADAIPCDRERFLDEMQLQIEMGLPAFVVRDASAPYSTRKSKANLLVDPSSKTLLTCTDVVPGEANTKYADKALFIRGTGKRGKKEVHADVQLGLTNSMRGIVLRDRDKYIGRVFEVGCCGADQEGSLIVPVFRNWKGP